MPERHYLLKVLGLSGIPRLATFGLTLVSFPLLLRALGASDYGVVLFIGSALGLFEVLLDFGVSLAAGKSMAAVRTHHPHDIRREFFAWARLQALFVSIGFVPMLLAAYLMTKGSPIFEDSTLLLVMAVSVALGVALNFVRANLQSLLAFKSLAVLDTFQSVTNSAGFIVVAFVYPTPLGLGIACLATVLASCVLATLLIAPRLYSKQSCHTPIVQDHPEPGFGNQMVKQRVRESANFLWLRLSTRLFQEGPILILGRLLGVEVIGVIGAFRKISEIFGTPYLVVGNALMVRVNEVASQGEDALHALWDSALRIVSTALLFSALLYLFAEPLAHVLIPSSNRAPHLFAVMSALAAISAISGILSPMSDYLGGLLSRNIFLSVMAVVQMTLLWIVGSTGDTERTVAIYVATNLVLVIGYIVIAHNVFFHEVVPKIRREVVVFSSVIVTSLVASTWLTHVTMSLAKVKPLDGEILIFFNVALFLMMVVVALLLQRKTIRYYLNKYFFEFTPVQTSKLK